MGLTKSQFVTRGSRIVLPITDFIVETILLCRFVMPSLVFSSRNYRCTLDIQSSNIKMSRGANVLLTVMIDEVRLIESSKWCPMLDLIGAEVKNAWAEKHGGLNIEFSNKLMLSIKPEVYEGWHFRSDDASLIGADGRLI